MTRDDLEAAVWSAGGRAMTGAAVDEIIAAADEYISERLAGTPRVLRHTSGTDLYPAIGALAEALLGDPVQSIAEHRRTRARQLYALATGDAA